jgi:Ankyrin repeats (3 copies)
MGRHSRLPVVHDCPLQYLASRYRPAMWKEDNDGWLPLHLACRSGTPGAVEYLSCEFPGAARRGTRTERWVPLHILAQRQYDFSATAEVDRVITIVDIWPRGLRERDSNGWLPLHYAVRGMPLELVRRFVRGWPTALQTATSDTKALPLHLAANSPYRDAGLLQFLAEAFPPALRARDADGRLPLHRCVTCASSRLDEVQFVGRAFSGAFGEKDANGWLPLHHAAAHTSAGVVRYLADEWMQGLLEPTNDGRLPLHVAAQHIASRLGVILVLAHAEPRALQIQSGDGSLPLHLAAASPSGESPKEVVATIERLAHGWPQALDVCDGRGMRPVHVAASSNAPLDAIYVLARMVPHAVLHLGPEVLGRATAAPPAVTPRHSRSESCWEAAAESRACCSGDGSTTCCTML